MDSPLETGPSPRVDVAPPGADPQAAAPHESLLEQLQRQAAESTHLRAALLAREAALVQSQVSLKHAEAKIQALTLEPAHLKRLRYGVKSEALSPEQRDLFQEAVATDQAAIEAETEQATPAPRKQRARAGRQALPAHLPRVEIRHEPDTCTCGQRGQNLVQIGEDISEQLDIEPAKFSVIRHLRPQYACRACGTISAATIIDGGLAAPGLLTWG